METGTSIGNYLIERLYDLGVGHVFGVPGDYVLGFYDQLQHSGIKIVNTCDEQGAGLAADAYARLKGLGVVCVTYCVGGLKIANSTAQAFAEKSPVVVISGAPGIRERVKNPLLHHKVRDFDTQKRVFEQLTIASTVLDNPETAFAEIDRVLAAALRYKRPVYLELPRDMVSQIGVAGPRPPAEPPESDADALSEILAEAEAMINAATQPVVIADVEIHRFGLQEALIEFVEKTNIPVAATILSKSVIRESHPLYLGVYEGAMGQDGVRDYVESSDCWIMLGTFLTDFNLGMYTAKLDMGRAISVTSESASIRHHSFENVLLQDFLGGLLRADVARRDDRPIPHPAPPQTFVAVPGEKITVSRLFQYLNGYIDEDTIVIADVGDALLGGGDLFIHRGSEFLSPAYYTSLGFAAPASLGAELAAPNLRPLVLIGDGAFQMTGMELSTSARFGLHPIVIVFNNRGYTTERPMLDGSFNDLLEWRYSRIPDVLGAGRGFVVDTEEQLEAALQSAREEKGISLVEVRLDPHDMSSGLKRLTDRLAERVR